MTSVRPTEPPILLNTVHGSKMKWEHHRSVKWAFKLEFKQIQVKVHFSILRYSEGSSVYWSSIQQNAVQCSAVLSSAVQCSAVLCYTVQCGAVLCSTVHCSEVICSTVQFMAAICSSVQCIAVLCSAVLCSAVQQLILNNVCAHFDDGLGAKI